MSTTKVLAAVVMLACIAFPHAALSAANQTTTALSVSGVVKRGQTITLTATVSGAHNVYVVSMGLCNDFQFSNIEFIDASTGTVLGVVGATDQNSGNYNVTYTTPPYQYCNAGWAAYSNTTTATLSYTIPQYAKSLDIYAKFVIADAPHTVGSQSATYLANLPSNNSAVVSFLLNN